MLKCYLLTVSNRKIRPLLTPGWPARAEHEREGGRLLAAQVTTRTSHYDRFTASGTGCIRNGRLVPPRRPGRERGDFARARVKGPRGRPEFICGQIDVDACIQWRIGTISTIGLHFPIYSYGNSLINKLLLRLL